MFSDVMDLTSYDRVRYFLELTQDNVATKRAILNWISTVSARVQDFLGRQILIAERVEYQDVSPNQNVFFIDAPPIVSIASVLADPTGLYTSYVAQSDYYSGPDDDSVVLAFPIIPGQKGIKITYTGGLCSHATKSVYNLSTAADLVVGQFIEGQDSFAFGKVKSISGDDVSIEILLGRFQDLESYKVYTSDALTGEIESSAGSIASIGSRCLAEAHPLIVTAVEMEIRYLYTHKKDFENSKSSADGTDRRDGTVKYELQPEVQAYLQHYCKVSI
jgi:hypothetical protein